MKKFLPVIFIIFLSFWALRPLLHDGFFPVHDNGQPFRVFEMFQSLHDGMFPVRWTKDFGYNFGYPLFNFYAPLAYYIGSLFMVTGFDVLISTKLMIALGIVLAGVFMFLFAQEFWGKAGGVFAAVLYIYAPYHAVDVYVRGDGAEMWAYAFIPLTFLGFYKVIQEHEKEPNQRNILPMTNRKTWRWIILSSLSFAAIITSHNLTAMMVTPFLLCFSGLLIVLSKKKLQRMYSLFVTILLSVLLSAFYWIPVFTEMKYTDVFSQIGGGFDFHQHFVCWPQFWSSPWGYGGSAPGCTQDGLSFMVGKISILCTLIGLVISFFIKKDIKQKYILWICVPLLGASFLLATDVSKPLWETIHTMAFFQFPWRFLVMISFFLSFMAGIIVWFIQKKVFLPKLVMFGGWLVLIIFIIFLQSKYFKAKEFYQAGSGYFSDPSVIGWDLSGASSEYMPQHFIKPKTKAQLPQNTFQFLNKNNKILQQQKQTNLASAKVLAASPSILHVNIAYFPAWNIFVDNSKTSIIQVKNGMNISVPAGEHTITARFIQTPTEKVADGISIAGIVLLFLGIISERSFYEKNHS